MENNTEPNQTQTPNSSSFDAKTTSWVAYLTWIGFIIAICAGDKEGAKFHLNQALVILLANVAGIILQFIVFNLNNFGTNFVQKMLIMRNYN